MRICFVCSGNICRSPMAEVVMRSRVAEAGLAELVEIDSAGTGDWHIGERADRRARMVLAAHGYDAETHRARQFDPAWYPDLDLVIALDGGHARTLRFWATSDAERAKVRLLRSFDRQVEAGADLDVPDPYYDGPGAFEDALSLIESGCAGLLHELAITEAPVERSASSARWRRA